MKKNTPPNAVSIAIDSNRESSMTAYIHDECDCGKHKQRTVEVKIKADCRGIYISPKGYETDFDDTPILLEVWDGKLRVVIWGVKDEEDPSQIIELECLRKKGKRHG